MIDIVLVMSHAESSLESALRRTEPGFGAQLSWAQVLENRDQGVTGVRVRRAVERHAPSPVPFYALLHC